MGYVNPNKPVGLSPIASLSASNYTGKGRLYYIDATNTSPFYIGDLVTVTGTGDPKTGLPGIQLATAGNAAVGVVMALGVTPDGGAYANPSNLDITWRPAGANVKNYYALVEDDPNVIYEIQEGGTGTNLTAGALQSNANILYALPQPSVVLSGTTLDNTTVATTATLNLKIVSLVRRVDNNFVTTAPGTGGGAQKWWVLINNHIYRAGTTGV
jgi:hypothetical protein